MKVLYHNYSEQNDHGYHYGIIIKCATNSLRQNPFNTVFILGLFIHVWRSNSVQLLLALSVIFCSFLCLYHYTAHLQRNVAKPSIHTLIPVFMSKVKWNECKSISVFRSNWDISVCACACVRLCVCPRPGGGAPASCGDRLSPKQPFVSFSHTNPVKHLNYIHQGHKKQTLKGVLSAGWVTIYQRVTSWDQATFSKYCKHSGCN